MGASTSVSLRPEEIDELRQGSHFSSKQIQRLWARFRKLDRGSKGAIMASDFFKIPELAMNPLAHRISAALELGNNTGEVNFRGFVKAMSVFHDKAPIERKLAFVFSVYDVDGDGRVSVDDLRSVLKSLVGTNMDDAEIDSLAADTIAEYDADRDEGLNLAEFRQCMTDGADGPGIDFLRTQMTINF